MGKIHECCGVNVTDYEGLYRWSIAEPAAFWDLMWQFAGIIATCKGTQTAADADKMPGTKWFPEARLNYAENLLLKGHENQCAIIFHGENGESQRLSYGGLYRHVSQLAQALRYDGVKPDDRVAGILPNRPESIIAMLATTSLGAIWSSCSPDFGVAGIVDRFSQITPKVLFVGDGYFFQR